jgi:hypothetical protein
MRKRIALLAALALAGLMAVGVGPQQAGADTSTTYASENSYTSQSSPTSTHANQTLNSNAGPSSERRVYVKFVVAGIPVGATNVTATMSLYSQSSATSSKIYTAKQVASTWTEAGLTWNNQPAPGSTISTVAGLPTNAYVSWNVSSYVTGNGTWSVLVTTNNTSTRWFDQWELGTSVAPKLVMTWTSATQAAPTVTTTAATAITSSTATLNGTVNPNGAATTYQFQYGLTTGYGSLAPASPGSAGSGTVAVNESAPITGLTASTLYHFRLTANNSGGTTNGGDLTFTTSAGAQSPPTVMTTAASSITSSGATLNGTVNPNGASTTYQFEYGLTTGYGTVVPTTPGSAGSGTVAVNESAPVSGLTASTLYHFRLNATNSGGTSNGSDLTFTTSAVSTDLLTRTDLLKATEIGEWQTDGTPTVNQPIAQETIDAGFKVIRFAVADCFTGSNCGSDNHAGTASRTAFDTAIQGIKNNLQPAALWFKLLPTSHDYPSTSIATSFCPPWTGTANQNLAMYEDQVNEIHSAGWTGPIIIELSNEMYFDCTSGSSGPWDVQSGTSLSGGSVGVSKRVGEHYAANAPALKTYAQGLGFTQVVVGDDIGVPGGASWGQTYVADVNGPYGYTWTYSPRWIDEFNNAVHNAGVAAPDFEAWHSYVHSPDNYQGAPYESSLGDPGSATDDDQILYSYARGQISLYRQHADTIWGATVGDQIRFAISEGAAGSANGGGSWSGWTTGTRAADFYSGWLNMLTGDGNLTGTGTRYWEYTVFCDACNSSSPGNLYDVIKPDGTTPSWYATFRDFTP